MLSHSSCVWLFVNPWAVACQSHSLSVGFSRQEYRSGLPCLLQPRGTSWPRDQACVSCVAGGFFMHWVIMVHCCCSELISCTCSNLIPVQSCLLRYLPLLFSFSSSLLPQCLSHAFLFALNTFPLTYVHGSLNNLLRVEYSSLPNNLLQPSILPKMVTFPSILLSSPWFILSLNHISYLCTFLSCFLL